jgi:hypothetical protein
MKKDGGTYSFSEPEHASTIICNSAQCPFDADKETAAACFSDILVSAAERILFYSLLRS